LAMAAGRPAYGVLRGARPPACPARVPPVCSAGELCRRRYTGCVYGGCCRVVRPPWNVAGSSAGQAGCAPVWRHWRRRARRCSGWRVVAQGGRAGGVGGGQGARGVGGGWGGGRWVGVRGVGWWGVTVSTVLCAEGEGVLHGGPVLSSPHVSGCFSSPSLCVRVVGGSARRPVLPAQKGSTWCGVCGVFAGSAPPGSAWNGVATACACPSG